MNVGEEYLDGAPGAEKVGDLNLSSIVSIRPVDPSLYNAYHGQKIGAVRSIMSEVASFAGGYSVYLPTSSSGA